MIKASFSRAIPAGEAIGTSRQRKRERGIWQRRYWEHQIRNEDDLTAHVDYIHYNPVKHGYVDRAADWPYSSIHRYIRQGWLREDWAGGEASALQGGLGEWGLLGLAAQPTVLCDSTAYPTNHDPRRLG